jgi:MinD-like ATPase involved in chromosome partitioning or flagellar assembly
VQKPSIKKAAATTIPRVIAITSGKGGVGKSSIAVNLGISLAKKGSKVCLFDADTGLANINILLGMRPQYTLEHVLFGAKAIDEIMLDGPFGMKVVPGASGISECVTLHPRQQLRLTRELSKVESEFDYLIIDTAAGISDTTLDFVSAAHHALVVITPEPTSLTDAFSLIKLLKRRRSGIQYQIVVNMCTSANQSKEVYHRFCAAVEKYIGVDTHYLGYILLDESLRAAVALQNPVAMFPDTDPSCRGFIRLADSLEKATEDTSNKTSFSGYWHRQFRDQRASKGELNTPIKKAPDTPSATSRDNDYLSELRSRLLLLIDQGHTDTEMMEGFLKELIEAFINRFGDSPLDTVTLVEQLVASPNRDDELLRKIFNAVKHWGPKKTPISLVDELLNTDAAVPDPERKPLDGKKPEQTNEAAEPPSVDSLNDETAKINKPEPVVKEEVSYRAHHYDNSRFGSQDKLLALLKQQPDDAKPLLTLLGFLS